MYDNKHKHQRKNKWKSTNQAQSEPRNKIGNQLIKTDLIMCNDKH